MTDGFTCTDKETLITYLYGECDPAERRLVESHLGGCAACAQEVEAFRGVRGALAAWAPPERATGFRIVADEALEPAEVRTATVLRPRRWWQAPMPGLMRAAAAILLFAGGAAVANLEVRYDNDGFVVRTGWMRPDARETAAPGVVPVSAPTASAPWRSDLASLERRLANRFDERLVASTPATQPGGAGGVRPLDERVFLSRVEDLIAQSEQRIQREMAYRISELSGEVSAQRISDLRRMEQGLGATGAEALQNRQMINYLLTVSQKK
jgi:anti-sigma factor RsiW